jgi:hypothetical protein
VPGTVPEENDSEVADILGVASVRECLKSATVKHTCRSVGISSSGLDEPIAVTRTWGKQLKCGIG